MRSTEDLITQLDADFSWRRKEIIAIRARGSDPSVGPLDREIFRRSGAMIFYAHWEGFVKRSAGSYIEFIALQRMKFKQYPDFLITHFLRSRIEKVSSPEEATRIVKLIACDPEFAPKVPYKGVIDTGSNLNSQYLKRICLQIGIEYNHFETKEKFIDSIILKTRNEIAHGSRHRLDEGQFISIADVVIELCSTFKNQIENSAVTGSFKLPA